MHRFDNHGIPSLAVLIKGGRLSVESREKLEQYLKDPKLRGSAHKCLILQEDQMTDVKIMRRGRAYDNDEIREAVMAGEIDDRTAAAMYSLSRGLQGGLTAAIEELKESSGPTTHDKVVAALHSAVKNRSDKSGAPEAARALADIAKRLEEQQEIERVERVAQEKAAAEALAEAEVAVQAMDPVGESFNNHTHCCPRCEGSGYGAGTVLSNCGPSVIVKCPDCGGPPPIPGAVFTQTIGSVTPVAFQAPSPEPKEGVESARLANSVVYEKVQGVSHFRLPLDSNTIKATLLAFFAFLGVCAICAAVVACSGAT